MGSEDSDQGVGGMDGPRHPMQPLIRDDQGVIRFKKNAIVRYLIDHGSIDLNQWQ